MHKMQMFVTADYFTFLNAQLDNYYNYKLLNSNGDKCLIFSDYI